MSGYVTIDTAAMAVQYPNGVPLTEHVGAYIDILECQPHNLEHVRAADLQVWEEAIRSGELEDDNRLRLREITYFSISSAKGSYSVGALEIADKELFDSDYITFAGARYRGRLIFEIGPIHLVAMKSSIIEHPMEAIYSGCEATLVIEHERSASDESIRCFANAFLFELSASYGLDLQFSPIRGIAFGPDPFVDIMEPEVIMDGQRPLSIASDQEGSELCGMWLSACQDVVPSSAFLQFVKCIEYVAVTVVQIEQHEALRTYLTSRVRPALDAEYLRGLVSTVEEYQRAKRDDRQLIKMTIQRCAVKDALPESVEEVFPKLWSAMERNESQQIDSEILRVAEAIYDTRNSLVHAKPNYKSTGREISIINDDVVDVMRSFSLMAVRWYLRCPPRIRIG